MVDRTSQIWSVSNLCRSFLVTWLTVPAKYGLSVIFAVHSSWNGCRTTQIWNVSTRCQLFLHYKALVWKHTFCLYMNHRTKTTVVCCNPVFCCGSSHMNHCTALHVRVGLAQARPNNSPPSGHEKT